MAAMTHSFFRCTKNEKSAQLAKSGAGILERYGWLVGLGSGTVVRGAARKEVWRAVDSPVTNLAL